MCWYVYVLQAGAFYLRLSRRGNAYSYIYVSVVFVPTRECMVVGSVTWTRRAFSAQLAQTLEPTESFEPVT